MNRPPSRCPFFEAIPVAALLAMTLAVHLTSDGLPGFDPYFHARYASMLPGRLFARTFPATEYSVWRDRWGDKEFLFHLGLMPFVQGERWIVPGTRLAGAVLVAGFLLSWVHVMRRQGIRGAAWWAAALLCASGTWWYRMSLVRAYLGAMFWFPWIVFFFEQRRTRALALTTFGFAWTYTAPHLALAFVAVLAAGRTLLGRMRSDLRAPEGGAGDGRLLLASLGATAAALVIHPNFPNHLVTHWIHLSRVITRAWGIGDDGGVELGDEFKSETVRFMLEADTGTWVALAAAWVVAAFGQKPASPRTALLLWLTLPCFALAGLSHRFIEFLAPSSLWALGSAVTDQAAGRPWHDLIPRRGYRLLGLTLGLFVAGGLMFWTFLGTFGRVWNPQWRFTQEAGAAWLRDHAAPGDLVVHVNWGQFPELFFHAPELRYLVGLDPMLMDAIHPREIRLLEDIRRGRRSFTLDTIRTAFPEGRFFVTWSPTGVRAERVRPEDASPDYSDDVVDIYALRTAQEQEGAR